VKKILIAEAVAMKALTLVCAIALTLGTTLVSAQTMNNPAAGPSPKEIAASATVPSTKAFVQTAAAANQFEIVSSELALTKTKNKEIVDFANRMITDHTQIGKNFVAAMNKANTGISVPPGLGDDLDKIMARLKSEDGAAFESDYIAVQTKGHQDAVGLFAGYAKGGDNPVMQAFAKETLPTIEMHLRMCYALPTKKK
jgi:putative membrane protein